MVKPEARWRDEKNLCWSTRRHAGQETHHHFVFQRKTSNYFAGWWFGTFFIVLRIIPTDQYFSEGLKPPTSLSFPIVMLHYWRTIHKYACHTCRELVEFVLKTQFVSEKNMRIQLMTHDTHTHILFVDSSLKTEISGKKDFEKLYIQANLRWLKDELSHKNRDLSSFQAVVVRWWVAILRVRAPSCVG